MLHRLTNPQRPEWTLQLAALRRPADGRPDPDQLVARLHQLVAAQTPASGQALVLLDAPDGCVQLRLWIPERRDREQLLWQWALPTLCALQESRWMAICRSWPATDPLPGLSVQAHTVGFEPCEQTDGEIGLIGRQRVLRLPMESVAPPLALAPSRGERQRGKLLLGALAEHWADPDSAGARRRAAASQLRTYQA
jgi:hypothetical protein